MGMAHASWRGLAARRHRQTSRQTGARAPRTATGSADGTRVALLNTGATRDTRSTFRHPHSTYPYPPLRYRTRQVNTTDRFLCTQSHAERITLEYKYASSPRRRRGLVRCAGCDSTMGRSVQQSRLASAQRSRRGSGGGSLGRRLGGGARDDRLDAVHGRHGAVFDYVERLD